MMMNITHGQDDILPTGQQELLLKAVLLKGEEAVSAYHSWEKNLTIDTLDNESQRLLPLLFHNMRGHGLNDPFLVLCKGVHKKTFYRNHFIFKQVASLLNVLNDAGIKTVLLKGAAMQILYYKDYALRLMDDQAILLLENDIPDVMDLLSSMNCKIKPFFSKKKFRSSLYGNHARRFKNKDHHRAELNNPVPQDIYYGGADTDFWRSSIPVRIGPGLMSRRLDIADQAFHTIVHGLGGEMGPKPRPRLQWIPDMMAILGETSDMDWDRIIYHAGRNRLLLPLKTGVLYLYGLLNAPFPPEFLKKIEDVPVKKLELSGFRIRKIQVKYHGLFKNSWAPGKLWQVPFALIYHIATIIRRIRFKRGIF